MKDCDKVFPKNRTLMTWQQEEQDTYCFRDTRMETQLFGGKPFCEIGHRDKSGRLLLERMTYIPGMPSSSLLSFETGNQGEALAAVSCQSEDTELIYRVTAFPGSDTVEQQTTIRNRTKKQVRINLPFLMEYRWELPRNAQLWMMTGGGNFTGSHMLKKIPLYNGYYRHLSSKETPEVIRVDGKKESKEWFLEGSAVWQEFFCLCDGEHGYHITFDYAGVWEAQLSCEADQLSLRISFQESEVSLAPKESLALPVFRSGVFYDGVDGFGNQMLNFIYRYKWDFTNEDYFAKTNAFMFWINEEHTCMEQCDNAFHAANNARYIGAEIVHVDDFWYDRRGEWNNIGADDFAELNRYLSKSGQKLSVWYAPWHVDPECGVLRDHPTWEVEQDWAEWYGLHLDLSIDAVSKWQLELLNQKQRAWGCHMLKYDGEPMWPSGGSYGKMPKASQNWYRLLRTFRSSNPKAGVFGCASGGELMGVEALRYSDLHCVTDGHALHFNGYYNSLLVPPDKMMGGGSIVWGEPYRLSSRGEWRTEVQVNMNNAKAQVSKQYREKVRRDVERYRYFCSVGVAGRWVKVYRPRSEGMDETLLFQKMSRDQKKGYITIQTGLVKQRKDLRIFPGGLLPEERYYVSALEHSFSDQVKTGKEWMEQGIEIRDLKAGEMIFFNLEELPGIHKMKKNVLSPQNCLKKEAANMGYRGVELYWADTNQDTWISYASVLVNGKEKDRVSVGTYYFDIGGLIGNTYEIRLADGYGNYSKRVECK
ncbi:alpha-galactosidase [Diplocloster agilis]|uniref:alpha-galactosidase n=1 Tax=Diplocloster agilis TaxID=2850323 RepID=UPI000820919F|nr:alpha-galactosidase [Suonthocola fibrivorans]MCU6733268.1 alpha-galactosidase [Suonthocola fibrivorans]SCI83285.1 Alpha-galactosidase [uncultured Clostridium sp.]